jgi:hypothetical protein
VKYKHESDNVYISKQRMLIHTVLYIILKHLAQAIVCDDIACQEILLYKVV